MTTVVTPDEEVRTVAVKSMKAPILFGIFTVLFALFPVFAPRTVDAKFCLSTSCGRSDEVVVTVPSNLTMWIVVAILIVLTLLAFLSVMAEKKVPVWVPSLFVFALVFGFLVWSSSTGKSLTVVTLLSGALALATPLVLGALGGVIGERAGVVNIAIEAQLLGGAFTAAAIGSLTGSAWIGLIGAIIAGVLVSLVLAIFAITYYVNQVIVGVVLNVLVTGLTTFLVDAWLNPQGKNSPPLLPIIKIPVLSEIPILGPVLFNQSVLVYMMYVIVIVVSFAMFRTRWGLRLRAVGEHPQAADTVGIKVARTRYLNVMLAGGIAGIGGAYYTLVSNPEFGQGMTGGAGFIALAAVIFGKWDPVKATMAALLFGFATNLQSSLSVMNSGVPSQFLSMVPYVVTIFVVAGLVGRSRPPAASGIPYIKS